MVGKEDELLTLCVFLSLMVIYIHVFYVRKLDKLEGTARYAGLLLAPADSFGPRPRLFWAKKGFSRSLCSFQAIFGV